MSHDEKVQQMSKRTKFLEEQGLHVLRVTNDDVMGDLDAVTRRIHVGRRGVGLKTPVRPGSVPLPPGEG